MLKKEEKVLDDKLVLEGDIVSVMPGLAYEVMADFKGMKHKVTCYVSGKMKSNFIQLEKGDRVKVEISVYDIDKGRIVYRITQRKMSTPPRRAKK